jgi:hypothetical protein
MEEPGRQRQGRWKLAGTLRDTARERTGAAGDGEDRTTLWRDFATVVGILVVIVVILNMLLALSRIMNFPSGG